MEKIASLPPEHFYKVKPRLLPQKYSFLFEVDHVEQLPAMHVYRAENVELFEDGSIFENKKLLLPSLRDPEPMMGMYTPWRMFRRRWSYKKIALPTNVTYLSLLDHWGHEYYHWIVETLPRLELAVNHLEKITVIVSERHLKYDYIRESLKFFDVKVVALPLKSYAVLPQLHFTDFPGPSDYHRKSLMRGLHIRFAPSELPTARRRIFLSRAKARFRTITNEAEVFSYLKSQGFEMIHAEDLSWLDQRALFSQASHLITLHGAGLSNILFMPEGGLVVEIRKDNYGLDANGKPHPSKLCNTYYHMSSDLGHRYAALLCPSPTPDSHYIHSDLTVDVTALKELLAPVQG